MIQQQQQQRVIISGVLFGCIVCLLTSICYLGRDTNETSIVGVWRRFCNCNCTIDDTTIRSTGDWVVPDNAIPFNENGIASQTRHLIVVAGHSVPVVEHIRIGISEAVQNPTALLVFSGGQTRARLGPESEGMRYYRMADIMNLWNDHGSTGNNSSDGTNVNHTVRARTTTEEFATDSFQNLLFSICRFYEVTRSYPLTITMISYTFKQYRFETMHAPSLHWPSEYFRFVGRNPLVTSSSINFDLDTQSRMEVEKAVSHFEMDPYGCRSKVRTEKNPFIRTAPYIMSCPDMTAVLHHCGPERIEAAKVPWKGADAVSNTM